MELQLMTQEIIAMAFDEELRPLHKLSKSGEQAYRKMLEQKADEILFKHEHPIKWFIEKIKEFLNKE